MRKTNKYLVLVTAIMGLFLGISSSANANIVTDGSFADPANFNTNWSPIGGFIFTTNYLSQTSVALGTVGHLGSISQTLATNLGATYQISFSLAHPSGDDSLTSQFQVLFGGNTLLDLQPVAFSSNYINYSFSSIAAGLSTVLQFNEREDPAYMYLTNVSVNQVSAVPLPDGLPMFAAIIFGLGALGLHRRRELLATA